MPDMDWEKVSLVTAMGTAILSFMRGWVVPGSLFQRKCEEYDEVADFASTLADAFQVLSQQKRER